MSRSVPHDVSRPVEPIVVREIKALVEPVVCNGGDSATHEPAETYCEDTGVGYVVYECPECGRRTLYYHSAGDTDPCCTPRN